METDEQDIVQTQEQKKSISWCHLLISHIKPLTAVIADTEVLKQSLSLESLFKQLT